MANTAHLVAADPAEAREQWIAVFARDRADLGPGHAARQVSAEAARYAAGRPLEPVLAELRRAWTAELDCLDQLASQLLQLDVRSAMVELSPDHRQLAASQGGERALAASRQELTDVRARLALLAREPALLALPPDRLARERSDWRARQRTPQWPAVPWSESEPGVHQPRPEDLRLLAGRRDPTRGIPR
jgi:hypothetical protein